MINALLTDMKRPCVPAKPASATDISHLQPGEENEWDQFVLSSPSGTFFHLSGWKTIVERVLGRECFCLVARRDRRITGVFPISWVRSALFGNCLVSMPLAVYGGICADDEESWSRLFNAGSLLAERLGAKYLEMRNRTDPYPTSLPGRNLYVTFTQDLTPGADKLFQALPRDTRYAIRKSQKAGLDWVEDLTTDEFYEIYARSVHRLGTPVFPKSLFRALRSEFPESRLFGVRKGGKAIAGVLCFYFNGEVLPYYGGALTEYYKDCPNNFMYWNLIAQSCREGLRSFDFGRSKLGTGSIKFKESWSMQMTELPYRYKLIRANEVPSMSPVDAKFRTVVALWKRMPYPLTKIVGPPLVRLIPSI